MQNEQKHMKKPVVVAVSFPSFFFTFDKLLSFKILS